MSELDLIEKFVRAVAVRIAAAIARDIELWDFEIIATYLHRSIRTVREDVAVLPSFPKPITLPHCTGSIAPTLQGIGSGSMGGVAPRKEKSCLTIF